MADPDAIRYLRIAQADLAESFFGQVIASVRPRSASSGQSFLGPGAGARADTQLEPARNHRCAPGLRINTNEHRQAAALTHGHDEPKKSWSWPTPAPPVVCTGC